MQRKEMSREGDAEVEFHQGKKKEDHKLSMNVRKISDV